MGAVDQFLLDFIQQIQVLRSAYTQNYGAEIKRLFLRDVVKEIYSNEMPRTFCKLSDEIPSI